MNQVQKQGLTFIYPFSNQGEALPVISPVVIAYPNGTVKLLQADGILMSAEAGQKLGEALLHAVKLAQNGQKR